MDKIAVAILLLGAAILSYGPVTNYFSGPKSLKDCWCPGIEDFVAQAEGKEYCMYYDQVGVPTIGIGFNLYRPDAPQLISNLGLCYDEVVSGKQCLSDQQISTLFSYDLNWATEGAKNCVTTFWNHHSCIQNVMIDLTFNLGAIGFCSWGSFVDALNRWDYEGAYWDMVNTHRDWCDLVQTRCTRNSGLVRQCH